MPVKSTNTSRLQVGRAAKESGKVPEWDIAQTVPDPLAEALAFTLRERGHDIGPAPLVAGIALSADGRLSPDSAVKAALVQGHMAQLVSQTPRQISEAVLPAILFLKSRDACVLLGKDEENARIYWPSRGPEPLSITLAELDSLSVGHALLVAPGQRESQPELRQDAEVQGHWFWGTARRFWPDYLQVILASVVINLLALAVPIFTMNVYDRVFPNAALITLWSLVVGVALALCIDAVLKGLRATLIDAVGRRVDLAVSSTLFRHLADMKLSARSAPAGLLMNTLKDFEQVRDVFSSQTVATLTDLAFTVLFIAVIAYIGGPLAWPPAIALTLVILLGLLVLFPLRRATGDVRVAGGAKSAVSSEALNEMETLKAVGGQGRMQDRWEHQVVESARAEERARRLSTAAMTLTGLAGQLSSVGIVVIGVYLALQGQITMGAVIAAMILSGRALAPTAALAGLFVRSSFALSTLRSIDALMALPSDGTPGKRLLNAEITDGAFELRGTSLTYPEAPLPALSEISLSIAGGERVALIGPIGAGKSTLVRLLAGLYPPTEGLVLVDGINVAQLHPAHLRAQVQLVPQDPVLFSGTLAENIAFGKRGASDAEVLRAARLAGVDKIASAHPDGFAMPINERGRNLSGGQRQMVALARALLPNPKVLLLDEPTSSMDQQAEVLFVERLRVALSQRPMTLLVATHRMGLLDLTERVVLLNSGKIQTQGKRESVLASLKGGAP